MNEKPEAAAEHRVLILAPSGRDGPLAARMLANAGIDAQVCGDGHALAREISLGAGSVLLAEEALTRQTRDILTELLRVQPSWSDLPFLLLTAPGAESAAVMAALAELGNVALLERPVRVAALVSTVRAALRARGRQYELRDRFAIQELLAAIVESSDDAMISKTLEGTILTWNHGAERMFGHTAAEAIGRPITILIPHERHDEERMIIDRLKRGERIDHFETVRVTKGGRRLDISLSVSPIRDAGGRIIGASKVARDITAQKRSEEALREADRRKDEFLATLAHELRNPLAPIRNSLGLLELAARSDATIAQVREMMERQVNHMVRLVDDLMEVSRITRGKIELRKERIDIANVIRDAMETSQPLVEAAGATVTPAFPPEPLVVDADPVRLTQVFANLLNNAAKFSERAGTIWLSVRRDHGDVVVSVRDSGVGIAPEMLPRVFDMFTQIDGAQRGGQAGLGIGLTLVRSLVQMHDGTVAAHSGGVGQGSEFTVRLPLSTGVPSGAPPPCIARSTPLPLRVLVVDDNHDAADSLGMLLQFLGAEVAVVHDGEAALESIRSRRPAMVFLDLGMPGMDGYMVARRIRAEAELRDVTLIALTGWGQDEDRRRSLEEGFDHHLIKPAGVDALQALMSSVARRMAANSGAVPPGPDGMMPIAQTPEALPPPDGAGTSGLGTQRSSIRRAS